MLDLKNVQKRYRPSSSAFADEFGQAITPYNSGCYRSILVHQIYKPKNFPELYQKVGGWFEDEMEKVFTSEIPKGMRLVRELDSKFEDNGVKFHGKKDFSILDHKDEIQEIIETKSVTSKNSRLKYIRKDEFNTGNMSQLVSYMIVEGVPKGRLVYGYVEQQENGDYIILESKTYHVDINDVGVITINGKVWNITAQNQVLHMTKTMEYLRNCEVGSRPRDAYKPFGSPCYFCPFKNTCEVFDRGDVSAEKFVEAAMLEAGTVEVRTPEINIYKPKKKSVDKVIKSK